MIIPREKIKGEKAIAVYPFSKTENWKYYSSFINRWDLLK
jgi:chlorite dismutase